MIAGPYTSAVFNHLGDCHPHICNGLPIDIPTDIYTECCKIGVAILVFKRGLLLAGLVVADIGSLLHIWTSQELLSLRF